MRKHVPLSSMESPLAWINPRTNWKLIGAHRGFRACYPENTLAAFNASIGCCAFIECDVRLSSDGEPVIIHDPTLERTSDILTSPVFKGSTQVADYTVAELQRLDMGSWFIEQDPFGTIAEGMVTRAGLRLQMPQQLLTLEELLRWSEEQAIALNLEIKPADTQDQGLMVVEKVVAAVASSPLKHAVLISSFAHEYLQQCKAIAPELATGALVDHTHPTDLLAYLRQLGVCAYHPNSDNIDAVTIRRLREAGFLVNVYTVNDPRRQTELFKSGATAVFTDYVWPDTGRQQEKEKEQ